MSDAIQPGVIVLGMHRSGTSAVTQLLEALGLFVGEEQDIKEKSWQNPHGFFERHDVRLISEALLKSVDADWWKVRTFRPAAIPDSIVADQLVEIEAVLAKLSAHGRWVLKEPRLCVLLPIFLKSIERPLIVFVFRNPMEVAKSLRRRNGIPTFAGLVLWEQYNIAALRASKNLDRVMLNYEDLVGAPAETTALLAQATADWSGMPVNDTDEAVATIDPNLRRETAPEDLTASVLSNEQHALWAALLSGKAETVPSLSKRSSHILKEFEQDESASRAAQDRLQVVEQELERRGTALKEQRGRASDMSRRLREAEGRPGQDGTEHPIPVLDGESAKETAALNRRIGELTEDLEHIRPLAEANRQAIVGALAQAEAAKQTAVGRAIRIEELSRLAEARESDWQHRSAELDRRVSGVTKALRDANDRASDAERRVKQITHSLGWRLIAPLRMFGNARSNPRQKEGLATDPAELAAYEPGPMESTEIRGGTRELGRVVAFSAIAGDIELASEPAILDPRVDYCLFTHRTIDYPPHSIWRPRQLDYFDADPRRTIAYVKSHPHLYFPDYEWSLWVDPEIRIAAIPEELIGAGNEDCDIIARLSPDRDCVYDEAKDLLALKNDDASVLEQHIQRLRDDGYPKKHGMLTTELVLFRHRRPGVVAMLNDWWRLIDNGSPIDRLSLSPAIHLHPALKIGYFSQNGGAPDSDGRISQDRVRVAGAAKDP